MLTGRYSIRVARISKARLLRVEEKDGDNGATFWRDADCDDLADMGVLDFARDRGSLALPIRRVISG